jgi:hypothetical protein
MLTYQRFVQALGCFVALVMISALPASAYEEELAVTKEENIEYSDEQLENVAVAYTSIVEIRQQLQEDLSQVSEAEQRQTLQEQANADMVKAVEETGLELATYNEIVEESQVNGNLRNRLMLMINLQQ